MNRVLVAFLVAFNLAIVIYMFHFYRIVNEVRQELKEEKEDTHRAERLQFRPLGKGKKNFNFEKFRYNTKFHIYIRLAPESVYNLDPSTIYGRSLDPTF